MKHIALTIFSVLILGNSLFSQTPQGINYQVIARDAAGQPLDGVQLLFNIKIKQGGDIYSESHTKTPNKFGLCQMIIGQGTSKTGAFNAIDWSIPTTILIGALGEGGPYLFGEQDFQSVPYSLYAENAANAKTAEQINGFTLANTTANPNDILVYTNGEWTPSAPTVGGTIFTGDVTGSSSTTVVTAIQGQAVSDTGPTTDGQVLTWNNTLSQWEAKTSTAPLPSKIEDETGSTYVDVQNPVGRVTMATAGVDRMVIDQEGKVGIGTISPEAALNIETGGVIQIGKVADNSKVFLRAGRLNFYQPFEAEIGNFNKSKLSSLALVARGESIIEMSLNDANEGNIAEVEIKNGLIKFDQIVEPISLGLSTENSLYNVDGDLFWNDYKLNNEPQPLSTVLEAGNSAGNKRITDVENPVNDQDVATKKYVDLLEAKLAQLQDDITLLQGGVKDLDGNVYNAVTIGNQVWMGENLKVTKYNDGTPITLVADTSAWASLSNSESEAYCYYDNDLGNVLSLGLLYNWYAVSSTTNGGRSVCPVGWHVPNYFEWETLSNFLGEPTSATQLKTISGWVNNGNGTDDYGFSAVPAGLIYPDGAFNMSVGVATMFWTSTNINSNEAWRYNLYEYRANTRRFQQDKNTGGSIRCLQN